MGTIALAAESKKQPGVIALALPATTLRRLDDRFPEGVNVLVCAPSELAPEFIRLPKAKEKCSVTGLSRSTLHDLLQRAGKQVRTHYLREKGAASGITLIHRQSLIDYISSMPAPEWQEAGEGEGEDHE